MSTKKPKPYRCDMFGILNPYGDIWTSDTFDTESAAQRHIESYWANQSLSVDLSEFRVIPVRVVVSAIESQP